jgi:DNA-binding MarR family transcriptional regulator
VEEADFVYLKEEAGATSGNLSVQIEKLREAGYIDVHKSFRGRMPCTKCSITQKGISAFEEYAQTLHSYLSSKK